MGMPYAYGPIFAFNNANLDISNVWGQVGGYLTPFLVVLGLVGLFGRRLRGLRIVLGAWVAFCVAKTFGPHLVLSVVNHLPGMNSVAFYRYMTPSLELAVVVLAALGLDDMVRRLVTRRDLFTAAVAAGALFWICDLIASPVTAGIPGAASATRWSLAWAFAMLAAVTLIAQVRNDGIRVWALVAVGLADVTLTFGVPTLSAPRGYREDTSTVTWLRSRIGLERAYSFGPIAANYGTYFDLPMAGVTDVPLPKLWVGFLRKRLGQSLDVLNMTNLPDAQAKVMAHPNTLRELAVRYVVVDHGAALPPSLRSQLTLEHQDTLADVYELAGTDAYFSTPSGACTTTGRSRVRAELTCDRPTTLVRREMYFPGWSATVNGRPATIARSDGLFQSIRVPAGRSTVSFDYDAPNLTMGLIAAVLGALWILGGLVDPEWVRARRRRGRSGLSGAHGDGGGFRDLREEVIALVVNHDESGEVDHVDLPDRLHP